jgi:hypothetical protein
MNRKRLIKNNFSISVENKRIDALYCRGFGVDTLEHARKFYLTYPLIGKSKSDALRRKSEFLCEDFR